MYVMYVCMCMCTCKTVKTLNTKRKCLKNEETKEPRSPDPRSRSVGRVRIHSSFVRVGRDIECTEGLDVQNECLRCNV